MEANKRRYQHQTGTSYIEGNTVRKQEYLEDPFTWQDYNALPDTRREKEIPSPRRQARRQPKTLSGISMASLFVLTVAIATTLYFCIEYLKLQYEVGKIEKEIVTMEHTLTGMKNENDAAYEQINMVYDLDYVYRVAVEELGMVYPNNNQVITYKNSAESYVRQYQDIPE